MRPDIFHYSFELEVKIPEKMERLRQCFGFFTNFLDEMGNSNVLDSFEAMHEEDMEWLRDVSKNKKVKFGEKKSAMHPTDVNDGEEKFLMPAPKGRPPRNRNRNTKSTLNPRPSRATRSSKVCVTVDLDDDSEPAVKKTRRTRQIKEESLCVETQPVAEVSSVILSETEMSVNAGSKKGRRTTRKRTTAAPRASRATRASTRTSYVCKLSGIGMKKSSVGRGMRSKESSVLQGIQNIPETRMTRSRNVNDTMPFSSTFILEEHKENKRATRSQAATPLENENAGIKSPEPQLTPCKMNSVKQRVKEFEVLIDKKDKESAGRSKSPYVGSPAPKKAKAIHSPLIKQNIFYSNKGGDKNTPFSSNLKNFALIEEEEDPANRTYEVVKSKGKKKGKNKNAEDEKEINSFDEVLDADDEWMSDEEEASSKKDKSRTPNRTKKGTDAKAPVQSTKALRSRNVQKISTEVAITSVTKIKPAESDAKEAELKKKMEKEEEARKRKEEIMKKRTETMKKKREEKMAKVKRTREELEKDVKAIKAKAGRGKKAKVLETEEIQSPPAKLKTPPPKPILAVANSTFNVNDQGVAVNSYDLTPCWQDVPPVQPDNPNDYGVADKSECSSEEENDPRKKVPDWAKIGHNHPNHLAQALAPSEWINSYWHSKPRKPTISEFFGNQVSKRTLKRGLNYRTSSACWNTPPLRR